MPINSLYHILFVILTLAEPYILPFIFFMLGVDDNIWMRLLILACSILSIHLQTLFFLDFSSFSYSNLIIYYAVQLVLIYFWCHLVYKIMGSHMGRRMVIILFYGALIGTTLLALPGLFPAE